MRPGKRTLEELANKSDSDDADYSDHPAPRRSKKPTSRKKPAGRAGRPKKRRRRDSDDIVSDDLDDLDDDMSFDELDSESDDPNVPRNARGTARRRTTTLSQPKYEERSDEEEFSGDNEEEDDDKMNVDSSPLASKASKVVTLKLEPEILSQFPVTRRVTRATRDASEDIVALTNSGRHMEYVERGTVSPAQEQVRRNSRKSSKQPVLSEILESAPQSMVSEEGVVPESENGDAKAQNNEHGEEDDDDDEAPTTRQRNRSARDQPVVEEEEEVVEEVTQVEEPRSSPSTSRKRPARARSFQRKTEESDFEPDEDASNDDSSSPTPQSARSARSRKSQSEAETSTTSRRPGLRARPSRAHSEVLEDEADEIAEELQELRPGRNLRRRLNTQVVREERSRRNRPEVDYRLIRPDMNLNTDDAEADIIMESPSRRGRGAANQRSLLPTYGPFGGAGAAILGRPGLLGAHGEDIDSDSSDDEDPQPYQTQGIPGITPSSLLAQPGAGAGSKKAPKTNTGLVRDQQALADADPLGVDLTVNFDGVGGLEGHVNQLKEMVSLPLMYPEIFQRLNITPPRGVLFHGPPGTGKTLLARALANSLSSENRKVSFYMRKGSDVLSKWAGEAERQLRVLFEEARKTQPSIIFFDEIDGLAPVRSAKSDSSSAASIVSTLLALMDGMDGRGQVILIGATNRPDHVDPALRRPGRFDREFYFPLPNLEARRAIIEIHTKGWDPELPSNVKADLAAMTKGYGGADLRALCTEAALNAVQRRYPQIYKSDKKLIIDPKTIEVIPKDLLIAAKNIVPSSQRSASSGAAALPENVEPLLRKSLAQIKASLKEILPQRKRLTALEEAQYEEPADGNEIRREKMMEEFDRARVFRPRFLVRGARGMGQGHLTAAILHQFEGLNVQSFDLPTLLGDPFGSPAATISHLFTEAKRNKPSVIIIPDINSWAENLPPSAISMLAQLMRQLPPSDPILLLGVLESTEEDVDNAILKELFGSSKKNVIYLTEPDQNERHEFFNKLIEYIKTPPSGFPDPDNRKLRKLEELEVAPPPAPKPEAQLTKQELKTQNKRDRYMLNLLKVRIQPVMDYIKSRYKRLRLPVIDESKLAYLWEDANPDIVTSDIPQEDAHIHRPYEIAEDKNGVTGLREVLTGKFFYNMDTTTIEKRLVNGYYKRPCDFLSDIKKLQKDARQTDDLDRQQKISELIPNVEVDMATIEQEYPDIVVDCENIYQRHLARVKQAMEKAKVDGEKGKAAEDNDPGNGSDEDEDGDGDVYMSHEENPGSRETQQSSFGPSAQPKPAYSNTAPSQQLRRESGLSSFSQKGPMTPMAPGTQPADYTNEASTTQTTSYKKSTEQSSHQTNASRQGDTLTASPRKTTFLILRAAANPPPLPARPQPPLFAAPPPPSLDGPSASSVTVDHERVEQLHAQLTLRTSGLSVEQLEQISSTLMACVWQMRSENDRTVVAEGISKAFDVALEDIQEGREEGLTS
ncbi:hypothetical protein N7532_011068 [Penicillium argentinense]|uniref:AAA+ ATPase domain-containing protein n=1 Tax=Penicillium argentinense TaxID=1131581 RepID=A0A9W9EHV4_9EURO|nr:uncharacterized protein N7532_011068 [Penicillium argentinense]KAJ5082025.1 hypothetical protein N7532_011068 [Penicillium argentinense]